MTSCYSNALFQDQEPEQEDIGDRWKQLNAELQKEFEQEEREKLIKSAPREVFAQHMSKILFPEHKDLQDFLHEEPVGSFTPRQQPNDTQLRDEGDCAVYISRNHVPNIGADNPQLDLDKINPPKTTNLEQPITKEDSLNISNQGKLLKEDFVQSIEEKQQDHQPLKSDFIKNQNDTKKTKAKKKKIKKSDAQKNQTEQIKSKVINATTATTKTSSQISSNLKQKIVDETPEKNNVQISRQQMQQNDVQSVEEDCFWDVVFGIIVVLGVLYFAIMFQPFWTGLFVHQSPIQNYQYYEKILPDFNFQNLRENFQQKVIGFQSIVTQYFNFEVQNQLQNDFWLETNDSIESAFSTLNQLLSSAPINIENYNNIVEIEMPEILTRSPQKQPSQNQQQKNYNFWGNLFNFASLANFNNKNNNNDIKNNNLPENSFEFLNGQSSKNLKPSSMRDRILRVKNQTKYFFSFLNPFLITKSIFQQFSEIRTNQTPDLNIDQKLKSLQSNIQYYLKNNYITNGFKFLIRIIQSLSQSFQNLLPNGRQLLWSSIGLVALSILALSVLALVPLIMDMQNAQNVVNVDDEFYNSSVSKQTSPGAQESGVGGLFVTPAQSLTHSHCSYNLRSRCKSQCSPSGQKSLNQSISFDDELKIRKGQSGYRRNKPDGDLVDTASTRVKQSKKVKKRLFK